MFSTIITVLLLCIILYSITIRSYETFTDIPLLVLQVTRSNANIHIINGNDHDITSIFSIDHIEFSTSECTDCIARIETFYDIMNSYEPTKLLAVLPTKQTCIFTKTRSLKEDSIKDIYTSGSVICYFDDKYIPLLKYIGYAFNVYKLNLKKITKPSQNECMFIVSEIEYIIPSFLQISNDYVILDIEGIDMNILRSFIPYIHITNKDFKRLLPNYNERYSIKTCLLFDNVLCASSSFNEIKYKNILTDIHDALDDIPLINYYSMFSSQQTRLDTVESFYNPANIQED